MKNVYIAACTEKGGIYRYNLTDEGKLDFLDKLSIPMPMYQIMEDKKMYILLRAPFEGDNTSGIMSAELTADGKLRGNEDLLSTKGIVACHLAKCDRDIYCVNYLSGNVIKMPETTAQHSGKGVNKDRQEAPHTHYVTVTPDKKYVLVTDLGLDTIFVYDRDLKPVNQYKVPEGHGVRHLLFSEDNKYLFSVNELASTVSAFSYDDGKLCLLDTIEILPKNNNKKSIAAAIRLHKGCIYASNRGHDSITKISFKNEKLKVEDNFYSGGKEPRDFDFIDDYLVCSNMASDNVSVFKEIDDKFILTDSISVPQPLCVSFFESEL